MKNNRNVIIALVTSVMLIGGVTTGLFLCFPENVSAYDEQVKLGEQYMDAGDYDSAEIAFNEAIKIDPKRPDAYDNLIEEFEKTGQQDKKDKIRKDRDRNVRPDPSHDVKDPKKPKTPVADPATGDEGFKDYVKKMDKATLGEEFTDESGSTGLISYALKDFDGDKDSELLTIECVDTYPLKLEATIYEDNDGNVEELCSEEIQMESEIRQNSLEGTGGQYELFLKSKGSDVYLFARRYIADPDRTIGGGLLYEADEDFDQMMDSAAVGESNDYEFTCNGETKQVDHVVSSSESTEGQADGETSTMEDLEKAYYTWADNSKDQLDTAGLNIREKFDQNNPLDAIRETMPKYSSSDKTHMRLCTITRGHWSGEELEDYDHGHQLKITDYTGSEEL